MKITKYGHACLLLEDNGKKLLIDPGAFSFDAEVTPEKIGGVDAILITHNHFDHMAVDAVKKIVEMQPTIVIGGTEIREDLEKENIEVQLPPAEETDIVGFKIKAFEAVHGDMPVPKAAENHAYLINGELLHPGDSYDTSTVPKGVKILALPSQGPWSRMVDAVNFAKIIKPEYFIPIHNAVLKDEIGKTFDGYLAGALEPEGIKCKALAVGESWQLD